MVADISLEAKDADQELAAGRPFITRHVRLLCDETKVTGMSEDVKRLVTLLTPSPDEPREGTIDWGGETLQVTLPGPRAVVEVHRLVKETVLAEGFWATTVHGSVCDDVFTAEAMEVYPLLDPREVDDPALPGFERKVGRKFSMHARQVLVLAKMDELREIAAQLAAVWK